MVTTIKKYWRLRGTHHMPRTSHMHAQQTLVHSTHFLPSGAHTDIVTSPADYLQHGKIIMSSIQRGTAHSVAVAESEPWDSWV